MARRSVIAGVGGYLPKRIVTNDELSRTIATTDEWIQERTGIKQRHIAGPTETCAFMGARAAAAALAHAGAGTEEVDAAVARAAAAFPSWRAVSPPDRARLLRDLADAVEERLEDLAVLEARNAGKPIGDARGEIEMVAETIRYYAAGPERLLGDTIPVAGGEALTFREPLGVVGLILVILLILLLLGKI